jgi:hypothetical protein
MSIKIIQDEMADGNGRDDGILDKRKRQDYHYYLR